MCGRDFEKLQERGELRFFNKQKVTSGLAAAITTSLMELRECNVTSSSLSPDDFVCSDKGQDIKLILQEYERYLDEHSLLDSSGLLALAVQLAASYNNEDEIIYLMPSFVQWASAEKAGQCPGGKPLSCLWIHFRKTDR